MNTPTISYIKFHITMVSSELITCPWIGQDEAILTWLKKYQCIIYHEHGKEKAKPHYQGLIGTTKDAYQFTKNLNDSFKYTFKTTGKLTGLKSFSKEWKSDDHLENFKMYMTKENSLVYNTLFNEKELSEYKEKYLKKKIEIKEKKTNPQKTSKDYITYIKAKFSRKTALNETIIDFKPKHDIPKLVDYATDFIYGERTARNGSEYVVRSYVNLAMYHLTGESQELLKSSHREKVIELLSF